MQQLRVEFLQLVSIQRTRLFYCISKCWLVDLSMGS